MNKDYIKYKNINKKIIPNNRGITLATLVLTLIIVLIIFGMVVYTGMELFEKAVQRKQISKIILIQSKVKSLGEENLFNGKELIGTSLSDLSTSDEEKYNSIKAEIEELDDENFYLLSLDDLESIGVNINEDEKYLVNYNTGEIVSLDGIKIEDEIVYRLSDVVEKLDLAYIYIGEEIAETIHISLKEEKQKVTVSQGGNVKEVTSDGVPIPQGFYYVGGKIDEGVVISDNANDANKGTSHAVAQTLEGNQFVWVPVRTSKIKPTIKTVNPIESILVTDSSGQNTYNLDANSGKTYTTDFYPGRSETYTFKVTDTEGNTQSKAITITNVNGPIYWDNNGQRVGQLWARYNGNSFGRKNITYTANNREPDVVTDYDGNTTYLKTALGANTDEELKTALNLADLSDTTANANAFKAILQAEFNHMTTSVENYGGFYVGRYETGGFNTTQCVVKAGEKDKSISGVNWYEMYNKTKTLSSTSVASTLIWGCQYDAMCNWLTSTSRIKQSDDTRTSYDTLNTGSISSDVDKNIYDLAGNVIEYTMETYGSGARIVRGGRYEDAYAVSNRNVGRPNYYQYHVGTRSALFIL